MLLPISLKSSHIWRTLLFPDMLAISVQGPSDMEEESIMHSVLEVVLPFPDCANMLFFPNAKVDGTLKQKGQSNISSQSEVPKITILVKRR